MAKTKRYSGEFLDMADHVIRVEIWQEGYSGLVGDIDFDIDPLTITWKDADKHEVLCGSAATLRLVSPGDRTFADLYSIAVGQIRMDVYKDNALYWSGLLDPEFYEEPYNSGSGYTVELAFSDFGILDRLSYNLEGFQSVSAVLSDALTRAGLLYTSIDKSLISTSLTAGGSPLTLLDVTVRSDNFYDEDGEAMTLKEVVEGMLLPLAIKMVQRAGKVWLYDLNGLYNGASSSVAVWSAEDSKLGVDKVYNNVKVTWSPYAASGLVTDADCWVKPSSASETAINEIFGRLVGDSTIFSYSCNTDPYYWQDPTGIGFTLWTNQAGKSVTIAAGSEARYYKIVPQYDGEESTGVAIMWCSYAFSYNPTPDFDWRVNGISPTTLKGHLSSVGNKMFETEKVYMPPVGASESIALRIRMNLLIDPRFNPFEEAVNLRWVAQKDFYDTWNSKGNYIYVPVRVVYELDGSGVKYYWNNKDVVSKDVSSDAVITRSGSYGTWSTTPQTGYLCYYDVSDREEQSGALGWKTNRQAINPHTHRLQTVMEKQDAGQYINLPVSTGGKVWIEVMDGGWMISDAGVNLSSSTVIDPGGLWSKMSMILAQSPEIEIIGKSQFGYELDADDIEYSATLNTNAKEELTLDTICGTSTKDMLTARGAYHNSTGRAQIKQFSRAGRTSQAENLLIGTLYSQYAGRKTMLTGEIATPYGGLQYLTDLNQAGKKFAVAGEVRHVRECVSDVTMIEIRPDEYSNE